MLQRGDSDIGWADLYIIPDRARSQRIRNKNIIVVYAAWFRIIDYTDPYDIEYACFMVSKPPPLPQWQALTTPLQPPVCTVYNMQRFSYFNQIIQVWLATMLSFVIVTVTYALLTRQSWSKDPRFAFVDSISSFCSSISIACHNPKCVNWTSFHTIGFPLFIKWCWHV